MEEDLSSGPRTRFNTKVSLFKYGDLVQVKQGFVINIYNKSLPMRVMSSSSPSFSKSFFFII